MDQALINALRPLSDTQVPILHTSILNPCFSYGEPAVTFMLTKTGQPWQFKALDSISTGMPSQYCYIVLAILQQISILQSVKQALGKCSL
jgi:hypothetical protein